MKAICHSGGCPGSDMIWENESTKYGIKTNAYSFYNHVNESKNPIILSQKELAEGFEHVRIADRTLKKGADAIIYPYIKNLLARNWFQVKNAESVFAIGKFEDGTFSRVAGGTGWAIQMAIDSKKEIFFFDQIGKKWNKYNYEMERFEQIDYVPKLTENFAGIGTRNINESGIKAIQEVLKNAESA
jgi:hypothetical protein